MTTATSLFLIAVGAILKFAVTADVSGVSLATIGVILIVVGIAGLIISLLRTAWWTERSHRGRPAVVQDRAVVQDPRPRY